MPNPLVDSPNLAHPPPVIGQIETFLKQAIQEMPPEPTPSGRGRPRVLPSLALWGGMLGCVLYGFSSQLALWRLLTQANFWFYPRFSFTDQAVYDRLEKEGATPLENLFNQISRLLHARLAPYVGHELASFAPAVYALDETTLDQVARSLPTLRQIPPGDSRLLPGKLAGLFDLRYQQWHKIEYIEAPLQNCKVKARTMVEELEKGTLVLADLGYFGFKWFDDLTDGGLRWISRLREKTSYSLLHTYYQEGETLDALVWLGAHRSDQAAHAVRLVQFRVGQTLYRYITNIQDPELLPPLEIGRLYARRWDIELAFKTIKQHLNLHLLWSAKPSLMLQQVWAILIIAQILQALQMEIAFRAQADPFEVSLALMVEYLPRYAYQGLDPVAIFVEQGRPLRFIRPSRRTHIQAPVIAAEQILALPAGLELTRIPRYAQRKCAPT